jgi:multiple sugar transport system substrate-binding protein
MIVLASMTLTVFSGCLKKEKTTKKAAVQKVELVYYKLFDQEDIMRPLIQQYEATHSNVTIKYKKFENQEDYYRTILNELAEGEGPDIFSVPNYWIKGNAKKISPLPTKTGSPKDFSDTFVSVAEKDLVFADPRDGETKVFGLPMSVDTLALYYNKGLYEDRVPSRGKPATTWDGFKDDVFKLTKADNSFERFEVAGTAMGRADNISRSMDILYLLMLQYKVNFYNDRLTLAEFSKQNAIGSNGTGYNPALEALKLYTSFGLASQKNYSWNEYMADPKSDLKEIEAFARGKVATIFGYSYAYEQIKAEIDALKKKGVQTISPDTVKIAAVPQVNDPDKSTEKRDTFANYFVETVSRNSENPDVAWDFLMFATSKDNLAYYHDKTHRPTSRRDLIEEQKQDAVYGVFAEQVGFAESLLIYDWEIYKQIFTTAIDGVLSTTVNLNNALKKAEESINAILPQEGILPAAELLPASKTPATSGTTSGKTTQSANSAASSSGTKTTTTTGTKK